MTKSTMKSICFQGLVLLAIASLIFVVLVKCEKEEPIPDDVWIGTGEILSALGNYSIETKPQCYSIHDLKYWYELCDAVMLPEHVKRCYDYRGRYE